VEKVSMFSKIDQELREEQKEAMQLLKRMRLKKMKRKEHLQEELSALQVRSLKLKKVLDEIREQSAKNIAKINDLKSKRKEKERLMKDYQKRVVKLTGVGNQVKLLLKTINTLNKKKKSKQDLVSKKLKENRVKQTQLDATKRRLESVKSKYQMLKARAKKLNDERIQKERLQGSLIKQAAILEKNLASVKQSLLVLKTKQLPNVKKEILGTEKSKEDNVKLYSQIQKEMEKMKASASKHTAELNKMKLALIPMQEGIKEIDAKRKERESKVRELNRLKKLVPSLKEKIGNLSSEEKVLLNHKKQVVELKNKLAAAQKRKADQTNRITELLNKIKIKEEKIKKLNY